jgi:hypothetical protein
MEAKDLRARNCHFMLQRTATLRFKSQLLLLLLLLRLHAALPPSPAAAAADTGTE